MQSLSREALKIAEMLERFGFNIQFLGSARSQTRQAFIRNPHTRFMKPFSCHLPFSIKEAYAHKIESVSLEKHAGLIKICGFSMQTKAYLF